MPFKHESLLILFHTCRSQNNTWTSFDMHDSCLGSGVMLLLQLGNQRVTAFLEPPLLLLFIFLILIAFPVINVSRRAQKPIKTCFTCGTSGRLLGARWMRHVSTDMLNYCLTHVGIGDNVQVIALRVLQSDKEGHQCIMGSELQPSLSVRAPLSHWSHHMKAATSNTRTQSLAV